MDEIDKPKISRQKFLKMTGGFMAGLGMAGYIPKGLPAASPAPESVKTNNVIKNLGGTEWTLHSEGSTEEIQASVPGDTYSDLLQAGRIPDPYFRENNDEVQWVAGQNWTYKRTFGVPDEMLNRDHVQLVCHGLDTLATVWVNGQKLADTDNMFRTYRLDVKSLLNKGENQLQVQFHPLDPYVQHHENDYKEKYGVDLNNDRSWVRKAPYMWGWDWCRKILTMGIWREIELRGFNQRVADVGIVQKHDHGRVHLEIDADIAGSEGKGLHTVTKVMYEGKLVTEKKTSVQDNRSTTSLTIKNPKLWWPNGLGDQNLYWVIAELRDSDDNVIDISHKCIGLREIEVLSPSQGTAMHVRVNGVPVFAKGADWVPADNIPARITPAILRSYIKDAADCHFNFIRLWGGGYYENDALLEACDELGIMLQFEFKFANTAYPVKDEDWMNNVKQEVEDQVRRCRNHPSIVIWSGNNEIRKFNGYYHLFRDVIGGIVNKLVPGAFYEVGSGAAGSGDIHSWGVWHGLKPFEDYLKIHGFVSEFGMQSFTNPKTVDSYTDPKDRTSIHSKVMDYHELSVDSKPVGTNRISYYMKQNFGSLPEDFESNLWLSQIMQAWGIRYGVEHWRRDRPHSMASTIWQFNDSWSGPSWSMIDWHHRWKALQYQSRHFFAPVLVSGLPDEKTGAVDLHVISDRKKDQKGTLQWTVTDLQGKTIHRGNQSESVKALSSRVTKHLDLSSEVASHGSNQLLIWPELEIGGKVVSRNLLMFGRPKNLSLPEPNIQVATKGSGKQYSLRLQSDAPALWVWASFENRDARYSDNFIHLKPGQPQVIKITLDKSMSKSKFDDLLKIQSVYDVAPGLRA